MDVDGPEVPIFARAILIAHQHDALPYLDMRITQQIEADRPAEASFFKALKVDAERQIAAGDWAPER